MDKMRSRSAARGRRREKGRQLCGRMQVMFEDVIGARRPGGSES